MLVDDNDDIIRSVKMLLEFNGYEVVTGTNGKDALSTLESLEQPPDLIISDINMPVMDGYAFFKTVSATPRFSKIPFVFLTALSSPEEIRVGKVLGADDYIVKPFQQSDLIATVQGKLLRRRIAEQATLKIQSGLQPVPEAPRTSLDQVPVLIMVAWDDRLGPMIVQQVPSNNVLKLPVDSIGFQLFGAASLIYGNKAISHAESILIKVDNIERSALLYFDSYPDPKMRAGVHQFMLAAIAPEITYADSLEIKRVLETATKTIKQKKLWNFKRDHERIAFILHFQGIDT
jgi:CheY-like chemotaxis protein